jgi:coiled-coil domain-containing protein 63/114
MKEFLSEITNAIQE